MLTLSKIWDRIFEVATEIRVHRPAPVPCPPCGVYGQLLQIGKPPVLWDSSYLARRQDCESTQVDGLCAFRNEVVVEKSVVADLIIGIIGDVLRHVAVENF